MNHRAVKLRMDFFVEHFEKRFPLLAAHLKSPKRESASSDSRKELEVLQFMLHVDNAQKYEPQGIFSTFPKSFKTLRGFLEQRRATLFMAALKFIVDAGRGAGHSFAISVHQVHQHHAENVSDLVDGVHVLEGAPAHDVHQMLGSHLPLR